MSFAPWKGPPPARVLIDSDNHYPYHSVETERIKLSIARDFRPDLWLNLGDHYDLESISRFEKDPGHALSGLQAEFDSSRGYWAAVAKLAPRVEFLEGNHEARLRKLVAEKPGLFGLRALRWERMAELPPPVKVWPSGTWREVGQVWCEHGDQVRTLGGNPAAWALRRRGARVVVFGHHHTPSWATERVYLPGGGLAVRQALGLGWGGDAKHATYAGTCPPWVGGFALVEHYRDRRGRWSVSVERITAEGGARWRGRTY